MNRYTANNSQKCGVRIAALRVQLPAGSGASAEAGVERGGCARDRVAGGTAKQRGEQRDGSGDKGRLRPKSLSPSDRRDQELNQRRRGRPPEAVGRLDDRDRHPAAPHELARQQRHEDHETQAVGPDRHDDPVEQDILPQRGDQRAADEAGKQQDAAEHQQAARPEPVDQRTNQWRAPAGNELRDRVGDRGLGAAPTELLDEGQQEHRVGMHDAGADGERGERPAEHQPRSPRSRSVCRAPGETAVG